MADITAKDVLAWLEANKVEDADALAKARAAVQNEKADEAFHKVSKALIETDTSKNEKSATEWQKRLFTLGTDVRREFKTETRNQQGRGNAQVEVSQISVETNDGTTVLVKVTKPVKK